MDQLTEEFKALAKKFSEQNDMRQKEMEIKQIEKKNTMAQTETYPYFQETISKRQSKIESALDNLTLSDVDDVVSLPESFDAISEDLKSLQRFFASSTMFLKPFEVRMRQKSIAELENRYKYLVKKLLPRRKFEFTSRKVPEEMKVKRMTMEDVLRDGKIVSNLPVEYSFVDYSTGFSKKIGENLALSDDSINMKDVFLSDLQDCTVELKGVPGILTITSLKNCKVFSGPVATSIFIENCSECVFVVPCQQLRVHDSTICDFRIHITSRAIIESTTQVTFAPYDWTYEGIEEDFKTAGLDLKTNHWDSVDDFNWLASDKPSPNWSRLNPGVRKDSEMKEVENATSLNV